MTIINKDPCIGKGADGVPIYKCPDATGQKKMDVLLFDARAIAAKERAATAVTAPPDATITPPKLPPALPKGIDLKDIPTAADLGLGDVLTTSTPSASDLVTQPLKKTEPPKVEQPPKEEPKAVDSSPASPPAAEAPVNPRFFSRTKTIAAPAPSTGVSVNKKEEAGCTGGVNTGACLGALDDGTRTTTRTVGGATISNTYNVNDVGNTSNIKLGCDERYFKKGDCDKPIKK